MSNRLTKGSQAPAFELTADDGSKVSLASLRGRKFILMFYPATESPGCTMQACAIRDEHDDIKSLGYEIFGVSSDSTAKQAAFRANHRLPFLQLSDPDRVVHRKFGITRWTHPFAILSGGRSRSTFVVNERGEIELAWYGVQTVGHAKRLLAFLSENALRG